jgi:hypothetical protein
MEFARLLFVFAINAFPMISQNPSCTASFFKAAAATAS